MIVFGTGRAHERADINDTSEQTVYGVWEKEPNAATVTPVARNQLQQLTLGEQSAGGQRFREIRGTGNISWDAGGDLGWYFDLTIGSGGGERVVAAPVESFGFVNVTTFEPSENNDPCLGTGQSFFYRLDIQSTFSRAPFSNVGAVASLPGAVNRSLIVGSEVGEGLLTQLQPILRPQTGTPPAGASTSLSQADTANLANRNASASTNPCLQQVAGGQSAKARPVSSPFLNCPLVPMRTWRDLPRGPR